MLQNKENCGLLYTFTSEDHLKYTYLNTNYIHVNESVVLGLFYNALSTAVFL
jgi:hypothetical protein